MGYVDLICKRGEFLSNHTENSREIVEFDAWENYDLINEFFGEHDKSLMCSKEEYFDGFDRTTWVDYVIMEHGKIISRAGIYKNNEESWEVAGVSTILEYRRKGYGEAVVRYCTEKILEAGKFATLSTKDTNTAMIHVAKKVGFKKY